MYDEFRDEFRDYVWSAQCVVKGLLVCLCPNGYMLSVVRTSILFAWYVHAAACMYVMATSKVVVVCAGQTSVVQGYGGCRGLERNAESLYHHACDKPNQDTTHSFREPTKALSTTCPSTGK